MNNHKIKYFSTGEIAKLCKVNKKTLFHYDDIGLFKPEKVLDNGYRYYSEYQLEVFDVICTLKNIGMSLKDIKAFMDKRNTHNIIDLFQYETNEIEKEIIRLKQMQELISNKTLLLKEAENIDDTIHIQNQPEEYMILSSKINSTKEPYDIETYTNHLNYCYSNNLNIGFPVGCTISKDNLLNGNYNDYSYYFTKVKKDPNNKEIVIKPKGTYVVGYLKGYYDKSPILYEKLINYIHEHNLTIISCSYEDTLIDSVAAKDINNYVIKISIQIKS